MKAFVTAAAALAVAAGLVAAPVLAGAPAGLTGPLHIPAPSGPPSGGVIDVQDGPDFWVVSGVPAGDTLNIRSGAGVTFAVVARAPNGVVLRNLGCRGTGNGRWCQVETRDGRVRGWARGSFLRESGGSDVPELAVRSSGEIEVRWSSGCTMLYNARGNRIQAGGTCTASQRSRSDDAVARYLREQGGSTGGGGSFNMRGVGLVTQGGPLLGRITSNNGRSYAVILTATRDGFTCTGSFDRRPGGNDAMSTFLRCTNGASGSAILKGSLLTFSAGGKGGYVRFN